MSFERAFETDELFIQEKASILTGAADPRSVPLERPIGSIYLRTTGTLWQKTGSLANEWTQVQGGEGNTDPDPICKTSLTVDDNLNRTETYTQRNVFNTNAAINTGGFTVSSTGIEVPATGTYVAMATIFVTNTKEKADVGCAFGINGTRSLDALAATGYVKDKDGNEESSTNLTSAFQLTAGDELNLFFARIARSGNSEVELQTTSNVTIFKLQ